MVIPILFAYTKFPEYHVENVFGAHLTGDLTDAVQSGSQAMGSNRQIWKCRRIGCVGLLEMLGELRQMRHAFGDMMPMSMLTDDRRFGAGRSASEK